MILDMSDYISFSSVYNVYPDGRMVITFPLKDGKDAFSFAEVSKVSRNDEGKLEGHQRGEESKHIKTIRTYVEQEGAFIPNSVIIAFDNTVIFKKTGEDTGIVHIPKLDDESIPKPGFIIDGQQRLTAIRKADVVRFPIMVNAFFYEEETELLQQFMNVNSAKPIKKDLIFEMSALASESAEKYIALIMEELNFGLPVGDNSTYPLLGKIIFESTVGGFIPRRSIVLVINNSLNSEGLMAFIAENAENGDEFLDYSIDQLNYFFTAIAQTWPGEWGEKPESSRLLHGAGLFALGRMMDEIFRFYLSIRDNDVPLLPPSYFYYDELQLIAEKCHWSSGFWKFSADKEVYWKDLQNLSQDKRMLSEYLLKEYRQAVEDRYED